MQNQKTAPARIIDRLNPSPLQSLKFGNLISNESHAEVS